MSTPPIVRSLVRARCSAQLLSGPPVQSMEAVLERLLAVQAQDRRGALLAIRSRSTLTSMADVDDALTRHHRAVISWLNRGTLHLVASEDYWWLQPLTTPQLKTPNARRLEQEGVTSSAVERGIERITEAVTTDGPRSRSQLKTVLDRAKVRTEGQALIHLLVAASLRGLIVRGPVVEGQSVFVDVASWLGPSPPPLEPDEAWGRLARRYLAGHGPATAADLAKWAGVPLMQARRGLGVIADELTRNDDDRYDLADRMAPAALPAPKLLGVFDPVLHGWADRTPLVGPHQGVVTVNGIFKATALVHGHVVGTWGVQKDQVTLRLLEPISQTSTTALRRQARDVITYLGLPEARFVLVPPEG